MTNYEPDTPRAALAVGAMFLAGVSLAALVAAPALLDARNDAPGLLAAAKTRHDALPLVATANVRNDAPALLTAANGSAAALPIEVDVVPAHIDVIGIREPIMAHDVGQGATPDRDMVAPMLHAPNVAWALPNASAPCRPLG